MATTLTSSQLARLWTRAGGNPSFAPIMAKIAIRESAGQVRNNNRGLNKNGTVDWGLWQINDIWRKDPVVGPLFRTGAILTPEGNAKAAIHILSKQGAKAWATFNPSTDERFLNGLGTGPLGGHARGSGGTGTGPSVAPSTRTVPAPQASASPVLRRQLAAQWLLSKSKNPNDLLYQIQQAGADNPAPQEAQAPTSRPTQPRQAGGTGIPAGGGAAGSTPLARVARQRADIIDQKHLPYLWGGGHGGKVDPARATPLDCSGAVSAVLGINPRVSGDFMRWGRPGRAPGGRGITIYSNPHHVLMEIDGHFWGTSQSNPGKGAGWIPRSQISPGYLAGFTARHSAR